MSSTVDTIAFDFGRVIGHFDHGRTLARLTAHTDLSAEQMYALIYDGELEDAFESGRLTDAEFLRRFRELCRLGEGCNEAYLSAAVADIFWPNDELCAIIPRFKPRYRLVLGSNTNPIHSRHFVPQFAHVLRHFDALVLSHEIGARKPGRAFYERIVAAGNTVPERCVFVDDLAANVAGARACGLHGIVYTGVEPLRRELAGLGVEV
jgi:putative hydrolase of the HAD superfamily